MTAAQRTFTAVRPVSRDELAQRPFVLDTVERAMYDDLAQQMRDAGMKSVGKPTTRLQWVRPDKPGRPTAWRKTVRLRATARLVTMTQTGVAR